MQNKQNGLTVRKHKLEIQRRNVPIVLVILLLLLLKIETLDSKDLF